MKQALTILDRRYGG